MFLKTLDEFCGSKFWDLNTTWYTDQPELTPCFEKTVLVWAPSIILLIALPIEIYYIWSSKDRNIPWNWLNISKVIFLLTVVTLCVVDYVYNSQKTAPSKIDLYASMVRIFTFGVIFVLVLYNREKGLQFSGVQFVFWFLMVVCGAFPLLSSIKRVLKNEVELFDIITYVCYYGFVLLTFLLYFFADKAPKYSEHPPQERPCPEFSSSFPSQIWFGWMKPLILKGSRGPLTHEDLWNLNNNDTALVVTSNFEKYWKKSILNRSKPSKAKFSEDGNSVSFTLPSKRNISILPVLFKAFGPTFLTSSALRLMVDFLNFANPQILRLLILFVEGNDYMWHGFLYAFGFLLVTTLQTFTLAHYNRIASLVGMRIRCALTIAIYKKSLKLSTNARKDSSVGKIVNLMAVDAQSFQMLMFLLNQIWSAPLQISLAIYFLWDLFGLCVIPGIIALIICIPLNAFIINYGKKLQMRQMKYKDDRIKLMNEILSGIKVLKLYAWEKSFEKQISDIREKELKILRKAAYVTAFTGFLWSSVPFVVALLIFTTYVLADDNNILTPDKAFVALSLINIMRFPMSIFPMLISALIMSSVSIKRINAFMNSEELDPSAINSDKSFADPIIVENGSFDWDGIESINPTLHNINMRVKTGALVAVVGSVGTGKSSLISALLGELSKQSGLVNIKGSIAYVPQQAWLQNATLRENILFGKTYDARKYAKIIKHCALEQDLDMLPGGDMTEIGEKGINLSGGQKQRVSLARAVYNDTDIYFLDDPLSAVDSHVGKHIFENVIGPKGVLKNKTRILVTHAVTYLPEVDLILVMNDGTISESGTYRELLAKKGEFAEFLFQYMKERNDEVDSEGIEDLKKQLLEHKEDLPLNLSRELSRQCSSNSEQKLHRTISMESKNSDHKNNSVNNLLTKGKEDKLIQSESLEIGKVNWNVYKYYIKAVGMRVAMTFMFLTALYQVFSVSGNAWLSVWSTDVVAPSNTTNNSSNQTFYLEVYGILGIGQILAKLLSQLSAAAGGVYAARYIQKKMLIRVLHSPMSFFDTTPLGRIMNRFSKDIDTVDNTLPTCLQMVLNFCAMLVSTICVITFTTPIFIFVIIPVIILNFSIQRFYVKTARQMQRLESVSKSPVYSHFSESLSGVQTLRAYKVQKAFINQCEKNVDRNLSCFYLSASSNRWVSVRLESLGNLLVFSAAIFAVLAKDMSPGLVGLSLTYALQITTMLFMLVREATNLETNTVSVERIKEYSELNEEAPWELEHKPDPRWPLKGSIEFKDYAVSYRKGLDPVLKGVSFKVKSGEKVGIVGQTGAGKSSLTMALFRILEATHGQITIDDCDISKIGLHDLRTRLTIIPQDPVLFSGTLRINLDPFGEQKDDSIWYALELANLKNFVKGLPAGLQHQMSEGGENLSVGQRQLICLARALLRRSKILVLDEATAAVDLETDDVIQQTIRLVFKESTVLTIAHRLNTIMDYDRVLVIDKGLVVEFDSPKNLLSKNTSKFYQLAKDAGIVQ